MEWLEPWEDVDSNNKLRLEKELQWELHTSHVLNNILVEVVGRNAAADDILVRLPPSKAHEFAVVHLTWRQENTISWPATVFYLDWEDFVKNRMQQDNFGY